VKLASTLPSRDKHLSFLNVLSSESSVKLALTLPSRDKHLSFLNVWLFFPDNRWHILNPRAD